MAGPSAQAIAWAVAALGDTVARSVVPLREGGAPWLIRTPDGASGVLRVGKLEHPAEAAGMATEAAALEAAERLGVAAPRLLAADLGGYAGWLALLITEVPGRSIIPLTSSAARLRAFGAAVARLAAVPLAPTVALPLRRRPLADEDFAAVRAGTDSGPLLAVAEERLAALPVPQSPTVLVHGDLWHGNVMWVDDDVTAIIDWDAAGAGPCGIDLGGARLDAALLFGPDASAPVLAGWEAGLGRTAADVAYWDVVAALATQPDMAAWIPAIHDQGRTDLTADVLNDRRDDFLRAAMRTLT